MLSGCNPPGAVERRTRPDKRVENIVLLISKGHLHLGDQNQQQTTTSVDKTCSLALQSFSRTSCRSVLGFISRKLGQRSTGGNPETGDEVCGLSGLLP